MNGDELFVKWLKCKLICAVITLLESVNFKKSAFSDCACAQTEKMFEFNSLCVSPF